MNERPARETNGSSPVPTRSVISERPILVGLIAVLVLAGVAVVLAGRDFEAARDAVGLAWSHLKAAPAPVYFAVMSVVLLAPIPASILYVTAGPIYGIVPSLLWIAPALAINTLLVHLIAGGVLRPRLEALVARRGLRIPRLETRADQALFIALVRITPGIPYFVQSWVLGLAHLERLPFVAISVAVQMLYATGFVVLGRSAAEGRAGLAVAAIGALVAISIGARFVHKRYRRSVIERRADAEPTMEPTMEPRDHDVRRG